MIFFDVNGEPAGHTFRQSEETVTYKVAVTVRGVAGKCRIEIVQDGVVKRIERLGGQGNWEARTATTSPVEDSTWFAARCYVEDSNGRERFAHSAPIFIDVPGKPLRPKKPEVEYLISRVKAEIERNTGVLSNEALSEYLAALAAYEEIAKNAK